MIADPNLPFFVYGALKPDEISWPLIKDEVSSQRGGVLSGHQLALIDGIPSAVPSNTHGVQGFILDIKEPGKVFERLSKFEKVPEHYEWAIGLVDGTEVNFLRAAKDPKTRVDYVDDWSAADDPYFGSLVPMSFKKLRHLSTVLNTADHWSVEYTEAFLELQSVYALLWILTERLYLFREGYTTDDLVDRVDKIGTKPEWARAIDAVDIQANMGVRSNSAPYSDAPRRVGINGFRAWYDLRNNIVHRGKGAQKEVGSLLVAAKDMHNVLATLLQNISPSVKKKWERLTAEQGDQYSDELYIIQK